MSASIDLRRAGPGWTVHFRCGGSATISGIARNPNGNSFEIVFDGDVTNYTFLSGACIRSDQLHIVGLDPPPMTEAQMREALAEIAKQTKRLHDEVMRISVPSSDFLSRLGYYAQTILALAEEKS